MDRPGAGHGRMGGLLSFWGLTPDEKVLYRQRAPLGRIDKLSISGLRAAGISSGLTNEIKSLMGIDQRPRPKSINGRARPL